MAKLYERVLVGYDGSESARDALALALRLVGDGGTLILACIVEHRWSRPRAPERAVAAAKALLADARADVPRGIRVELRTPVASSAARGLTELAEAEEVDLLAVGSDHGAPGDGRIGLTRTAIRLLQGGPCAIAVAPPGMRERDPFRHVGVALDGSPEAGAALAAAYAIARAGSSAMTLYSAVQPIGDDDREIRLAAQERLDEAAERAPDRLNPRTELLYGAAGLKIASAADGVIDLLVCGSRGYGPVQRALLGSVSEELIARATHPVLVVPRPSAGGRDHTGIAERPSSRPTIAETTSPGVVER
jgi:nucleotide-binding universal stress UspA family protein